MLEGHFEQARAVYIRILKLGGVSEQYAARARKSATVSFNASIARSDSLKAARGVFNEMRAADIAPNVVTFNTLINLAEDYETARGVFNEMRAAKIAPDVVTFNTLINLAEDYETARGVFNEMRAADIAPNVVTFSTLINLAEDYETARGVFNEMRAADIAPNVVTVTTVLAKAPDFATGLSFVDSLDRTLPVFSHGLYCALYAKDIVHLDSTKLIEIYLGGFRQFGEALESPIKQYRRAKRLADAFRVALIAPHTHAAQKFFRERYAACLPLFRSAMESGVENDNLHYAFGIAAALNKDWALAMEHLPIARERAYHPARVEYIDRLLLQSPPGFRVEPNSFA
jgi:pentatricopeptide repeat protein